MSMLKRCKRCNVTKDLLDFYQFKRAKSGVMSICKICSRSASIVWQRNNPKKHAASSVLWRSRNKVKVLAAERLRYSKNPEKFRRRNRNRITINAYVQERLRTDVGFKLKLYLRNRTRAAISNNQRSGSAVRDLGCSIPELKLYLERQFQEGMSWGNYGRRTGQWSLDHIRPLASFDLTNRKEFLRACSYINLRPLWHIDNLKKGAKS